MIKKILGLNMGHDGGCTLLIQGKIASTMSEERLNRVKYSYGWTSSLKYCLEKTKTELSEIGLVVFSDYSDNVKDGFSGGLNFFGLPKKKCIKVDHHLSHACSAFFTSSFDKALIYVFDAKGNNQDTESIFVAEGNKIKKVAGNPIKNYKRGIVSAYQAFTAYFGWHQNSAGKTMGLSSYGDPDLYSKLPIYKKDRNGLYYNNLKKYTAEGVESFCKTNNLRVPQKFSTHPFIYKDMAAWIQAEFERAVIGIVNEYRKETGIKNLCLAGGGALNTVCNTKILQQTKIKNIHIFPAAGDSGQSIGNALYGYYIHGNNKRRKLAWLDDYRKQFYDDKDIESSLRRFSEITNLVIPKSPNLRYEKVKDVARETAKLISSGKIVGWFQGGSEVGPRALGHRSILCDPRNDEMKDNLNKRVKHRESFRPFAGSVLLDRMSDFFIWDRDSPFMLFVVPVKEEKKEKIPAVTHIDGTCRIQTVTKKNNGLYYDLIEEYYKITGIPLVLNTSFNISGEPIVEMPTDAVKCFLGTGLEYLVIGSYLVSKAS